MNLSVLSNLLLIIVGTLIFANFSFAGDSRELPLRKIPNLAENGEAYYAPDGIHLIAQVNDPDGQDPGRGKVGGGLT